MRRAELVGQLRGTRRRILAAFKPAAHEHPTSHDELNLITVGPGANNNALHRASAPQHDGLGNHMV